MIYNTAFLQNTCSFTKFGSNEGSQTYPSSPRWEASYEVKGIEEEEEEPVSITFPEVIAQHEVSFAKIIGIFH